MKTERPRQGDVVAYPYRWKHQPSNKIENPKDRPVCIALLLKSKLGNDLIALLAISDQPPNDKSLALELNKQDQLAAGLSTQRRAYIHISEMNIDEVANSLTFNPNAKTYGRLPQPTLRRLLDMLGKQLRSKNIAIIHREKNG